MQKEKIVITIETRQKTVVRKNRRPNFQCCGICGTEMQMYPPEEAAGICGVSTREIYRRVEHGELHFTEIPNGTLLICNRTLFGS